MKKKLNFHLTLYRYGIYLVYISFVLALPGLTMPGGAF